MLSITWRIFLLFYFYFSSSKRQKLKNKGQSMYKGIMDLLNWLTCTDHSVPVKRMSERMNKKFNVDGKAHTFPSAAEAH